MVDQEPVAGLIRRIGVYLEEDHFELDPDAVIRTSLPGIDSLRLKELLLYLEEEYDVEFSPDVMTRLETARDLSDHIESLRTAAA